MARVFTREEFYELVWSKPLTHLVKEFSISDVALHNDGPMRVRTAGVRAVGAEDLFR